jgi:hypothetical protein
MYWRDYSQQRFKQSLLLLLASLRFVSVFFASFLFLKPMLERTTKTVEKPIIAVIQDNSASIPTDYTQVDGAWLSRYQQAFAPLNERAELIYLNFDHDLHEGWDSLRGQGASTNLNQTLLTLGDFFSGRNLAAVVLATDGIFNSGPDPLYTAKLLQTPLFAIGLGDTTIHQDIIVSEVEVNKFTYLGNQFPVRIHIDARLCEGRQTQVNILHEGKKIASHAISISEKRQFITLPFDLTSQQKGVQKFEAIIEPIPGEKSTENNRYVFYIDVIDDRQKILLVGHAPHPDIAALQASLDQSEQYQCEYKSAAEWNGQSAGYGLVILHGMPADAQESNWIKSTTNQNIPQLFIATESTQWGLFNALGTGWKLEGSNGSMVEKSPQLNGDFTLFQAPTSMQTGIANWPPLVVPFGNLQSAAGCQSFLSSRIGSISTTQPLMSLSGPDTQKKGLLFGDGIWRWRIQEYAQVQSHQRFDDMVLSWVKYLTRIKSKSPLQVDVKNKFNQDEHVVLHAQLYDLNNTPIGQKEIQLTVVDENKKSLELTFVPDNQGYRIDMGQLAPGKYKYVAKSNNGTQPCQATGVWEVMELSNERTNTLAQHQTLRSLAAQTGGQFHLPVTLDSLVHQIQAMNRLASISYEDSTRDEWIDLSWVMVLILVLLSAEWLMRKYQGTY